MFLARALVIVAVVISLTSCTTMEKPHEIAVGQVWTIKDAPNETVRLTIARIERYGELTAVHVSVDGAPTRSNNDGGTTNVVLGIIGHMPFEKTVLVASIDELQDVDSKPSRFFEQGYSEWEAASGGLFSIPVSEAITISMNMISQATAEEK